MPSVKSGSQRAVAGVVAVTAMSVSLTACGSSAPKPVASIDALKGESTAIKLALSLATALTKLKLTPDVLGSATLKKGPLIFPTTGRVAGFGDVKVNGKVAATDAYLFALDVAPSSR